MKIVEFKTKTKTKSKLEGTNCSVEQPAYF